MSRKVLFSMFLLTSIFFTVWQVEAAPLAVLLQSSLDEQAAITNPVSGSGGSSTLLPSDFVPAQVGNGAHFSGANKVAMFPASNIDLDRGEVSFWYRPNYEAELDDIQHHLMVVGDVYNPPNLILTEADSLQLTFTDAGWNNYGTAAPWRADLWDAGQWVHIRAVWDRAGADPLQLYVDGMRVDGGGTGGWNVSVNSSIFVGAGDGSGAFSADGAIDELIIRADPQLPPTPTPTASPTAGPSPTPTPQPTPLPGGGLTDPAVVVTPVPLALPPVGQWFSDPAFGTLLRHIGGGMDNSDFTTHIYSQLQAFSVGNTYVLLIDGQNGYHVRRLSDLALMPLNTGEWNAPKWHPTLPDTLIHYDSNADTTLRLQHTNVATGVTTTVYTFPAGFERIRGNQSSDETSRDGRWITGMATHSTLDSVIFALDMQTWTLGAQISVDSLYDGAACIPDQWGNVEPDWIAASPLGNYLVVQWPRDWNPGADRCRGLESFELGTGVFVGRIYEGHQHGDLGIDTDGSEFFMTTEVAAPPPFGNNPAFGKRTLPGPATGVQAPEFLLVAEWGHGGHISCQGPAGVCLVSNNPSIDPGWRAMDAELMLLYTNGNVVRLTHHRSSVCGYWVQPRASLSRNGQYVIFASDWGAETGQASCNPTWQLGAGDAFIINLHPSPTAVEARPVSIDNELPAPSLALTIATWAVSFVITILVALIMRLVIRDWRLA